MKRVVTFGRQPTQKPKHNLAEVHFPELAKLDTGTQEGFISRVLTSDGGDSRALPRTIYFQKSQEPGHDGSVAVGALHEMTIDGETGVLSGKGWLLDSEDGRDAALHIAGQALFHNSVDLAEVKVDIVDHGDFFSDDYWMEVIFTEWKLGATTLVGKPAFADAHAILPEDLTAACEAGPLVVDCPDHVIRIQLDHSDEEIAASAAGLPSWDHFHRPEPEEPHKIIVGAPDDDGWIPVYGHLGLWDTCHDGIEGYCTVIPRPHDNYASFNQPSVLTNRGQVEAGPIVLYGGHIPLHKAADDPANAWADVRVTAGVHGPWLSGVVRPGVALDDAKVYVARASRISGHWKGGRLKMIVCCNSEGFPVPGSGLSFSINANGLVDELVASFPACVADDVDYCCHDGCSAPAVTTRSIDDDIVERVCAAHADAAEVLAASVPDFLLKLDQLTPQQIQAVATWAEGNHSTAPTDNTIYVNTIDHSPNTWVITTSGTTEFAIEVDDDEVEFDADVERERRKRLLALAELDD